MLKQILSSPLVIGVVCLVLLATAARLIMLLSRKSRGPASYPYDSAGQLLSPAERSFLGVLEKVVEPGYVLLPKVRLADLINVRKGLPPAEAQRAFNRITSKHADFTVCRQSDYSIAAVIELDDQTHQRKERIARDGFVDQALAAAGIPILHIKAQSHYDPRLLSDQLAALLKSEPRPQPLISKP